MKTLITTIISSVVSISIATIVNKIKTNKKISEKFKSNNEIQNEALKLLLQNNLTNLYFVYEHNKEIPDYVYKNWLNQLAIYEKLGGNEYVHDLSERIKKWKVIKTDIIK